MTFLDPAAGLIGAAITLPILVALYLLKLRRKPLRVSSTLLWEQAVQDVQANVPLRWLRWSWLLVLQALALGALLAALARPTLPGIAGSADRTLIIIDTSASMNATDGVRDGAALPIAASPAFTRLDQAKAQARAIVDELRRAGSTAGSRRPEGMVVALAAQAKALTRWSTDHRELLDAIAAIEPTDQPGDLEAALDLVRAVAATDQSEESATRRTSVLILSDASFAPTRSDRSLPGGVDFRLIPIGPPNTLPAPDNLGIVAMAAKRDVENPALARVFVRVQNASEQRITTSLTFRADAEPVGVVPVDVPPSTRAADSSLTPGETSVSFELNRPQRSLLTAFIPREDRLAADNAASLLLRSVKAASVLLVGPGAESADPYAELRGPQGVDRFLLSLLREMDLGSVAVQSIAQYESAVSAMLSGEASSVAGADLIIFDRTTPSAPPRVPSLHIGAAPPRSGLLIEPLREGDPDFAPTRITLWQRTHPLLRSVPLDGVLISPPMRVTLPTVGSAQPAPKVSVLAESPAGPLIMLLDPAPETPGGRRLVLAFDLLRTNWGGDVSFPVFIASAIEYLTARGDSAAGRALLTTDTLSLLPAIGAKSIGLRGTDISFQIPPDRDGERISLGVVPKVGVYVVEQGDPRAEDPVVAVNLLNPLESALRVNPDIQLGSGDSVITTSARAGEAPRREIWPVFVLLAALLLSIEWVLYAWKLRS